MVSPDANAHKLLCEITEYFITPKAPLDAVYEAFDPLINYEEDSDRYPGVFVLPLKYVDAKAMMTVRPSEAAMSFCFRWM